MAGVRHILLRKIRKDFRTHANPADADIRPLLDDEIHRIIGEVGLHKIALAKEEDSVLRELLLIKVSVPAEKRSEIIEIKDVYKAKIVDLSPDSLVLEITGDPNKLDGFIGVIRPYGILEMARTGVTALARGDKKLKDELDYNEMI